MLYQALLTDYNCMPKHEVQQAKLALISVSQDGAISEKAGITYSDHWY